MSKEGLREGVLCVQGHALLVGVGGSGKQTLAKLAAFVAGCELFQIVRTRKYDEASFRDDLKSLFESVCNDNKKVASLLLRILHSDDAFVYTMVLRIAFQPT